jgi:hypothetical protein
MAKMLHSPVPTLLVVGHLKRGSNGDESSMASLTTRRGVTKAVQYTLGLRCQPHEFKYDQKIDTCLGDLMSLLLVNKSLSL